MPDQSLPITLYPDRLRGLLLIAVSAIMVAASIFLIGKNPVVGWIGAVLFGLMLIVFVVQLLPGSSSLELTSEGFTLTSLYVRSFRRWSDINDVRVVKVGRRQVVGFQYRPGYRAKATLRRFNRASAGIDGALPITYGMKVEDLADLMNEIKHHLTNGRP